MSTIDNITIWLSDAKKTHISGKSLAHTLYQYPVDILLTGELGAGKTTFLQGFFAELGIEDHVTSPTYALEQRYTADEHEVIHIDLYRLQESQATELLSHSGEHTGIRCIEWAERADAYHHEHIAILLEEQEEGRSLSVEFTDIAIPSREQTLEWRKVFMLPEHIAAHCDKVAEFAVQLGEHLQKEGYLFRPNALKAAGELHDLLRFVDFKPGASHIDEEDPKEAQEIWNKEKLHYKGLEHEAACAAFLRKQGYPAIADIVEVHGLTLPTPDRATLEQQLLFYADKRIMVDTVVTLDERFDDFANRYGNGEASERGKKWLQECKTLEAQLFPNGVPY